MKKLFFNLSAVGGVGTAKLFLPIGWALGVGSLFFLVMILLGKIMIKKGIFP